MIRFIHTSDWHLGMRARFLPEEARARFLAARFDAVRKIAEIAREEAAAFVVVAGDVFDHNLVDRRVVSQALEALRAFTVPVFLLPGNHDPLDPASIYAGERWQQEAPEGVRVLDGRELHEAAGVQVFGLPWTSKHPLADPVAGAYRAFEKPGPRVVVGHGSVDALAPDTTDPSLISGQALNRALAEGQVSYVALGDRHSALELPGSGGRARYSGSPVATDYGETRANRVLVVDIGADQVAVRERTVGAWTFLREQRELGGAEDIAALDQWLAALPDKHTTAVKLALVGTLNLAQSAELEELLERHGDTFALLNRWQRHSDLAVAPDAGDLEALELSGYARAALEELDSLAAADSDGPARDALNLLYRLAR